MKAALLGLAAAILAAIFALSLWLEARRQARRNARMSLGAFAKDKKRSFSCCANTLCFFQIGMRCECLLCGLERNEWIDQTASEEYADSVQKTALSSLEKELRRNIRLLDETTDWYLAANCRNALAECRYLLDAIEHRKAERNGKPERTSVL